MKKIKIDTLKKKTILLIFSLTVFLITGSALIVSHVVEKQITDKYMADQDVSIEVLSYSLAPMLDLYNYKQVEHLITLSLDYKNIASISVFDGNGTLISSVAKKNVSIEDVDIREYAIITNLKGIIGSIEVGFSKEYINNHIRTVTAVLIFSLMGGSILLCLGLYTLACRYIIEPLEDFTKTLKEINPEHFSSRVKIYRKDEIGTLATIFNRMADNMEKSHNSLQESENKYRSMMEAMSDPVYICSPEFKIEYINQAMLQKIGRDATGELCFKAIFDLNKRCPWCRFDKIQQGQSMAFDIISPDGNQFYHFSSAAIVHSDGVISMLTVLGDTTELKKLENQLIQTQKLESIGVLASGIAHDFNNILTAINGYTEIALMGTHDDLSLKKNLEKVLQASERARDLVSQILTFSRKSKEERKRVQIHLIIDEVIKFLHASLPSTINIQQQIDVENDTVLADPTRVYQILMNLCTNASHAMMQNGGILQINLKNITLDSNFTAPYPNMEPGAFIELTVSDTGHGMSPDILNRIFEPYFTTKEKGSGTGLGMAVVHGIVESHNGCIKVDSEPGKGSTFYVYLPVSVMDIKTEKEAKEPLPTGDERILFVDDEDALLEVGEQILKKLGYDVVGKTSSMEALELFRTKPDQFDLVITDMTMPDMTGDKLSKEFRKIRADIPIIIYTGYSESLPEEKAKGIGINAFIRKPIIIKDFANVVRKVLSENKGKK